MSAARRPRDLAHLLSTLERHVVGRQRAVLAVEGATVEEWRVLDFLADGGHIMSEVAEHVGLPSPTLTKIVDRLVANNVVYRRIDLEDRRKVRIFLAARGRSLHRRLAVIVAQSQENLADEQSLELLLEHLEAEIVPRETVSGG